MLRSADLTLVKIWWNIPRQPSVTRLGISKRSHKVRLYILYIGHMFVTVVWARSATEASAASLTPHSGRT